MRVCDKILRYLSKNKVKSLYGVPSGTISPVVDSLNDIDNIEFIITKNEAAASYAATKYEIKELKKSIEISMEHPRGPVYIGIQLDVKRKLYTGIDVSMPNPRKIETDYSGLDKVIKLIDECNNGVLIVGEVV